MKNYKPFCANVGYNTCVTRKEFIVTIYFENKTVQGTKPTFCAS